MKSYIEREREGGTRNIQRCEIIHSFEESNKEKRK